MSIAAIRETLARHTEAGFNPVTLRVENASAPVGALIAHDTEDWVVAEVDDESTVHLVRVMRDEPGLAKRVVDTGFAIYWVSWTAVYTCLTAAFGITSTWMWLTMFGLFGLGEGLGLTRNGTKSEATWRFADKGWARDILAQGYVGSYALRLLSMPWMIEGGVEAVPTWLALGPWVSICLGFAGWLSFHFWLDGRKG